MERTSRLRTQSQRQHAPEITPEQLWDQVEHERGAPGPVSISRQETEFVGRLNITTARNLHFLSLPSTHVELQLITSCKVSIEQDQVGHGIQMVFRSADSETVRKASRFVELIAQQGLTFLHSGSGRTKTFPYASSVRISIDPPKAFGLRGRLLGPRATPFFSFIRSRTGARLDLDGSSNEIHIGASTAEQLTEAVRLTQDLVANVEREYAEWEETRAPETSQSMQDLSKFHEEWFEWSVTARALLEAGKEVTFRPGECNSALLPPGGEIWPKLLAFS